MPRIPIQPECDCHIPVSAGEDIKLKILETNFDEKLSALSTELKAKLVPKDLITGISDVATEIDTTSYVYLDANGTPKKIDAKALLAFAKTIRFEKVTTLPETGEPNVIYLVPKSSSATGNIYDEYIYLNGTWELIGSTGIDLSDYYKKAETNAQIAASVGAESSARAGADSTLQTNIDAEKTRAEAAESALSDAKVDKEEGKTLTSNDLTDALKAAYDLTVQKAHTHANSGLLDSIVEKNLLTDDQISEINKVATKQDILTAGNNITISGTTISAKDTTYSSGDNISISADNKISANLVLASNLQATVDVGGVAAGTSFAAGSSLESILRAILCPAKVLDRIAVTTAPTKTEYVAGEVFNKAGMVVTAYYNIGPSAVVNNYTYSPAGALAKTDTKITISYTEDGVTKTTTQDITVASAHQAYYYCGTTVPTEISGEGWSDPEDIEDGVTKLTHTYNPTAKSYYAVAYPKAVGALIHVYNNDLTQFDLLADMDRSEVTLSSKSYYLYTFTEKGIVGEDKYDYVLKES